MRAWACFSPSLHPVLHGGAGDEDAVVAPQVPPCRAGGHAILDYEPHGQVNHPVGVLTAGWRQIRQDSMEVLVRHDSACCITTQWTGSRRTFPRLAA